MLISIHSWGWKPPSRSTTDCAAGAVLQNFSARLARLSEKLSLAFTGCRDCAVHRSDPGEICPRPSSISLAIYDDLIPRNDVQIRYIYIYIYSYTYIYIYTFKHNIYIHLYIIFYIYTHVERERERKKEREPNAV